MPSAYPTPDQPSSEVSSVSFGVGRLGVTFGADDPVVTDRLAHLYAGFPAIDRRGAELSIVLHRCGDAGPHQRFDSAALGEPVLEGMPLADHELRITRLINDRKLDAEPQLLHLHSAAVARGSRSMLLCGRSGSGKSTLTAKLTRAGWDYVTDEQVAIDPHDGRLFPYPRPITLRLDTWDHFPELTRPPDGTGGDPRNRRMEVSPVDLGTVSTAPTTPSAVLFPRFESGRPSTLTALESAAESVVRLTSCCYDLERLGFAGLDCLVGLAGLGASYDLVYDDLDAACELLGTAFETRAARVAVVARVEPTHDERRLAPGHVRRPPGAAGWLFADGSAVVFDPEHLRIARLTEPGLRLWADLREPLTIDRIVEYAGMLGSSERASIERWVLQLVRGDLLQRNSEQ